MAPHTFYWHDYETFGIDTRRDRPAQFAGIRTDAELNEIGEPLMIYCRPANDFLPDPQSCLITGITPQECLEKGMPEHQFAARIEQELSAPGTIGVGYNTIRFDDEITRFMFWRNLIDPYAREWQNQCGRWDLLDVVRTAYALRPDGIEWPKKPDGNPSFKLEDLARANGLSHAKAHDALSDVRATIALARLIRQRNTRLFDFCLELRKKDGVAEEVGIPGTALAKPFLHVSGMFPAVQGCIALLWPLATHPTNKNEVIAWDLAHDPSELWTLDAETIRLRMFSKSDALPEGVTRLPIKTIHLNKSPVVINNLKTLSADRAVLWNMDLERALRHAALAGGAPDMSAVWRDVFFRPPSGEAVDIDSDLYGGFVGNGDRRRLQQLRSLAAPQLATVRSSFEDPRLEELVFRYRARNFPDTLTEAENERWEEYRSAKLYDGTGGARTIDQLFEAIDNLSESANERDTAVLEALYEYVESIAPAPM